MTAHLSLFDHRHGEYAVWEEPQDNFEYILGADIALARGMGGERRHRHGSGDYSAFCVLKREPSRLVQVAEGYLQCEATHFGEICAAVGAWYHHAWVNLERNLADAPAAGLRRAGYPIERWYQPVQSLSITGTFAPQYFTQKTVATSKGLADTTIDYLNRGNLLLRSRPLLQELRSLQRDSRGIIITRSKDRSVALMMAVIVDATVGPPPPQAVPVAQDKGPAPFGVDADLWNRAKAQTRPAGLFREEAPEWDSGGDGAPEWDHQWGPQGSD